MVSVAVLASMRASLILSRCVARIVQSQSSNSQDDTRATAIKLVSFTTTLKLPDLTTQLLSSPVCMWQTGGTLGFRGIGFLPSRVGTIKSGRAPGILRDA